MTTIQKHKHRHLTPEQVSALRHTLDLASSGERSEPILCRPAETVENEVSSTLKEMHAVMAKVVELQEWFFPDDPESMRALRDIERHAESLPGLNGLGVTLTHMAFGHEYETDSYGEHPIISAIMTNSDLDTPGIGFAVVERDMFEYEIVERAGLEPCWDNCSACQLKEEQSSAGDSSSTKDRHD